MANLSSDRRINSPETALRDDLQGGVHEDALQACELDNGPLSPVQISVPRQWSMRICRRGKLFAEAVFFLRDDMPIRSSTKP